MRLSSDLRPTRLLLGAGALALAFAVGAAASSGASASAAAGPAAPVVAAVADDATGTSAALGPADDTSLAAADVSAALGDDIAAAPRGAGLRRFLLARTERAEITITTADGQKTFLYVRGSISAASSTSVTITLKDGTKQAFALDATTKVRSAGKAKAISDIATGGRGLVLGVKNADGTYSAKLVRLAAAK